MEALEGEKEKIKKCASMRGGGKKRREDDGNVQVRSLFGLQIFFEKKKKGWNANFNRVSRGLGKQR